MGFKPIFEEERQFFKEKTNIELPTDCWRNGTKIYLDITCNKPLYQFKVINSNIIITKNNVELFTEYQQKKINEIISLNTNKLKQLYDNSFNNLFEFVLEHKDHKFVIGYSGGKDSVTLYKIWLDVINYIQNKYEISINYVVNFANTSNDTADTYKFIKSEIPRDKINILNPKEGFYQWIKRNHYYTPSCLVRSCCAKFKEGQIDKAYDNQEEYIFVLGVRSKESTKRANYVFYMDDKFYNKLFNGKSNMPPKWVNIAPIVDWSDEDVWLYILKEKLNFNRQYKLGYNRCGCLICPYQSDYIDLLTAKYYPSLWDRWMKILEKEYITCYIESAQKWTLEEYKNGKWKLGKSKEQEIIHKKATPKRIKELAEVKGISEELAEKYFNKICTGCNKKLNSDEIAMNLKLFGRGIDTDRVKCKKCLCNELHITGKEYQERLFDFRNGGCKLF